MAQLFQDLVITGKMTPEMLQVIVENGTQRGLYGALVGIVALLCATKIWVTYTQK